MSSPRKNQKVKVSNIRPASGVVSNDGFKDGAQRPFTISFSLLNEREDKMGEMTAKELIRLIEILKAFCGCYNVREFSEKISSKISPVHNANDYSRFFATLSQDAELREVYVGDKRCFFWVNNPEKIIQIIAFCHHPEERKQKR